MFSRLVSRARAGALGDRADADLVRRWARDRDEAAFEALVGRHGPAVRGACGRLLGNRQDAEDAFQATFLLLARKAGAVGDPAAVGGWLHGVAVRTCLEARAAAARRRAKEREAPPRQPVAPDPARAEALAALDEEVAALPEPFRAAVVLCELMGKARSTAAAELGCPEGTVASRVARGRALLAGRLAGRGIGLPAGVLAGGAAVPPALAQSTVRIAGLVAAGDRTAVPAAVAQLLPTGWSGTMATSLKSAVAAALTAGAVGGAAWVAADTAPRPPAPAAQAPPAANPKPADTPAARFAKLKAEYDADIKANTRPGVDRKTGQPIPNAFEVTQPQVGKYAARLMELGRSADEPTAAAALTLAACGWTQEQLADDAFDLLLERFADGPLLAEFAWEEHHQGYNGKVRRLQRVLGVATDPRVRALSLFGLAREMEPGHSPSQMPAGPARDEKRRATAAALYRRLLAEHPDLKGGIIHDRTRIPILDMARDRLRELEGKDPPAKK